MAGINDRLILLGFRMRTAHGAAFMLVEVPMLGAEQA
jgi:hypothetical protein